MRHTRQTYEMAVAAIAHTGEKKPSYDEWVELIENRQSENMTRVEKVTAVMVKEVIKTKK